MEGWAEELPHAPKPEAKGGGWEEIPLIQDKKNPSKMASVVRGH